MLRLGLATVLIVLMVLFSNLGAVAAEPSGGAKSNPPTKINGAGESGSLELNSADGKSKIRAKILDVHDDTVRLRRGDGREFSSSINRFDAAAKDLIRRWAERRQTETALAKVWEIMGVRPRPKFSEVSRMTGHQGAIKLLEITHDGQVVISVSTDGTCRAWDADTGKQLSKLSVKPVGAIRCVKVPGKAQLAAAADDKNIYLWDFKTGKVAKTLQGHTGPIDYLHFNRNGTALFSTSGKRELLEWDVASGESQRPHKLKRPQTEYDYQSVGSLHNFGLAGYDKGYRLDIWNPSYKMTTPWQLPSRTRNIRHAVISNRGRVVVRTPSRKTYVLMPKRLFKPGEKGGVLGSIVLAENCRPTDCIAFTRVGYHLMLADLNGRLRYWGGDYYGESLEFMLPVKNASAVTIASDGMNLIYGLKDGSILRFRSPTLPKTTPEMQAFFGRKIGLLLRKGKFDELESIVAELRKTRESFAWSRRVTMLSHFYWQARLQHGKIAFFRTDIVAQFKKWAAKHPKSQTPRIALAGHYINVAWKHRGGGFAGTVKEEQWKNFRKFIDLARDELDEAKRLGGGDPHYYRHLTVVAKAQSWPAGEIRDLIKSVLDNTPNYFDTHVEMVQLLMPRWNGEPGEMEAYAESVADQVGGTRGDELYARMVRVIGMYHHTRELFQATQFDCKRMQRGLNSLIKNGPYDSGRVNLSCWWAVLRGDKELARKRFAQIEANGGRWDRRLWWGLESSYAMLMQESRIGGNAAKEWKWTRPAHSSRCRSVRFSADGTLLITAGRDGGRMSEVALWDASTSKSILRITGPQGEFTDADVFGGLLLAVGKRPLGERREVGTALFWDLEKAAGPFALFGKAELRPMVLLQVMRKTKTVLAIDVDGLVRVRNFPKDDERIIKVGHPVVAAHLSPDESKLIVWGDRGQFSAWNMKTLKKIETIRLPAADLPQRRNGLLLGDNTTLAVMTNNKQLESGHTVLSIAFRDTERSKVLTEHDWRSSFPGKIPPIAYSSRKGILALAGPSGAGVQIWDAGRRKRLAYFRPVSSALAISPDGKRVASVDPFNLLRVWDISDLADGIKKSP